MRDLPVLKLDLKAPEKFGNLAKELDQSERRSLATDLIELIKIDVGSMSAWLADAQSYLDELEDEGNAAPQDREQEGSGEEQLPSTELTLTAVVQFSARATDALLGEPDLAKASEPGGELLASWVSSQLRTKDPNWILETDPLIVHMSVTGLAWRKRSFDDLDGDFHSRFVPSTHMIFNASAKSVERMPRITEDFTRYPYEIERSIQRGTWVNYEPVFEENDPQAEKHFYECDCWLDLDDDGIDEPWIVTISRDDHAEVVKIEPRWSHKTVVDTDERLEFNPIHRNYAYKFLPDPKGGFLPMGFGKLLRRSEYSADKLLAAIVDTAQSAAQDGGYMSGGFGVPDKIELKGNRVNKIPTDGVPLDQVFQQKQAKQVSPGSVQVFEKLLTLGDRLAGTLNTLENAPASMTATLAKGLIDSGTQVQGAVHRRLVSSMTQEFKQFVRMADAYDQLPDGVSGAMAGAVAVTADPQLATEMHRSAVAGFYMETLKLPQVFKSQVMGMRLLQVMRLPKPEECIVPPSPAQATPKEKMDGMIGLLKARNENIKVIGMVAQQLTQSLLNMVQASGGMLDQRMALLQMAQLEQTVQRMMQQAGDASTTIDGLVNQPDNQASGGLLAPPTGANGPDLSGGAAGGPGDAGTGGGLPGA